LQVQSLTSKSSAPGLDLKTVLAGRIARAASVFCVDEIILFDDGQSEATNDRTQNRRPDQHARGKDQKRDPNALLELLLSYSECPPHLRKALFEYHADLGKSGLLPSLDIPHHLKADEWCQYREAVSIGPITATDYNNGTPHKKQKLGQHSGAVETLVDAGFPVSVPAEIPPHTRLTIKFASEAEPHNWSAAYNDTASYDTNTRPQISAQPVDPAAPREEGGYYWGYTVRRATSLSSVFTESPFDDGYDVSIGTSERGVPLQNALSPETSSPLPVKASHALLVIGGVAGLEVAVEADKELASKGIGRDNVGDLFDFYVNVCPGQGSRTIRSEEALWIALGQLRSWVTQAL